MKLEIDTEMAQQLFISLLNEDVHIIESEINALKKIKKRKEHQQRELESSTRYLEAIKCVRYYYGGVKYIPN